MEAEDGRRTFPLRGAGPRVPREAGARVPDLADGASQGLAFADLKQLCGLTDGNLSRHLGVLQDASLVEVTKGYEGNRPHTSCRLTRTGRLRFLEYLAVLEGLVRDAAKASIRVSGKAGAKQA